MLLTFRNFKGFSRGHISADDWENELGLSCNVDHVVGIINANPLTIAISDRWQGAGKEMQGILPNGKRFNCWPVSLHNKDERSGRRISRKTRLGWLPKDGDHTISVIPQDGECVVFVVDDFTSSWVEQMLQTFLFDDFQEDDYDLDDEVDEVETPEPVCFETFAIISIHHSNQGPRLAATFPHSGEMFAFTGHPIWLSDEKRNKVRFKMFLGDTGDVVKIVESEVKPRSSRSLRADGWTATQFVKDLGLNPETELNKFRVPAKVHPGPHLFIELDISKAMQFLSMPEVANA